MSTSTFPRPVAPSKAPWTAERVAKRLIALAEEHGTPNRFQLREVAGDGGSMLAMKISNIARLQWHAVNAELAAAKLQAGYEVRHGPGSPAYVTVKAL